MNMKNTFVNCAGWSWEDKLLYIKACVGESVPHEKLCGYASYSRSTILNSYKCDADYIYCYDSGMVSYDSGALLRPKGSREVLLSELKSGSKPKRTKVSYDKWNFECAWHAIKAFEDGEKLYTKRSHKDFVLIDNAPDVLRFLYDLHKRVETEMTERDIFIEECEKFSNHSKKLNIDEKRIVERMFDSGEFKFVGGKND